MEHVSICLHPLENILPEFHPTTFTHISLLRNVSHGQPSLQESLRYVVLFCFVLSTVSVTSPDKIRLKKEEEKNGYLIGKKLPLLLSTTFHLLKGGRARFACMRDSYAMLGWSMPLLISLMILNEKEIHGKGSDTVSWFTQKPFSPFLTCFPELDA